MSASYKLGITGLVSCVGNAGQNGWTTDDDCSLLGVK